jgi:glutamyl-tRNA reductase
VANRTPERAAKLAQALHAEALPWEAFPEQLAQTDIVLSSTSAPHPIIDRAMVQAAMRVRHGRPMFCIDMAVPRDVAPEISDLDNVFLYNIDDLEHVVAANRGERQRAALAAERLIQGEARQFQQWLAARAATPMIVALRQQAEDIRRSELAKALSRLQALGVQERQTIEALTVAIVNKLLHAPTVNLKRAFQEGREDYRQLIDSLFGLDHGGGVVLDADAAGANGAA